MINAVDPSLCKVWKVKYDKDLSDAIARMRKESLMVAPNRGVIKAGGITNAGLVGGDPHTWPQMQNFMEWLAPHLREVWRSWNLSEPVELKIWKSWFNITKQEAYVEEHDHGGSHIAVSFYLKKPKGSGNIEFRNHEQPMWVNYPRNLEKGKSQDFFMEVEADELDCLIFPGWLSHRVQPNPLKEERIVFSCNVHGVTEYSPVLI